VPPSTHPNAVDHDVIAIPYGVSCTQRHDRGLGLSLGRRGVGCGRAKRAGGGARVWAVGFSDVVLLIAAGLAAGTVNAIAGGGSLISFPALLAVGLPPISATVTNSVSVLPGYLSSVAASRIDLPQRRTLWPLLPTAAVSALAGATLLLVTPEDAFDFVVPFLVLGATAVLAFQVRLRRVVGQPRALAGGRPAVRAHVMVAIGSLYGGYFNAALGVILVAGLALVLDETMARVSALKNLISAVVGVTAVVVFALFGPVDWLAALVVAPATIVGGQVGARIARRVPGGVLKAAIVVFGTTIGLYLLWSAITGRG